MIFFAYLCKYIEAWGLEGDVDTRNYITVHAEVNAVVEFSVKVTGGVEHFGQRLEHDLGARDAVLGEQDLGEPPFAHHLQDVVILGQGHLPNRKNTLFERVDSLGSRPKMPPPPTRFVCGDSKLLSVLSIN
jgi:hypothetical protein